MRDRCPDGGVVQRSVDNSMKQEVCFSTLGHVVKKWPQTSALAQESVCGWLGKATTIDGARRQKLANW